MNARLVEYYIGTEHYNNTLNSNAKNISNVSKHFRTVHAGNLDHFSFFYLEQVKRPPTGGETHHTALQREVWWIFTLYTRILSGIDNGCESVFEMIIFL